MGKSIVSEKELQVIFMPKIKIAVNYLVQQIWNENKDVVKEIVYDVYNPIMYNRTNQFQEAWNTTTSMDRTHVEGEFFYDSTKLKPGAGGQHSSIWDISELATEGLIEIIYQGKAGDIEHTTKYAKDNPRFAGEEWTKKRDAWAALEKRIGRSKLKKWMEEGFKIAGLSVKSYGGSWGST